MLTDTHTHIYDEEYFDESEALNILEKTYQNGVKRVILIGTNSVDSMSAKKYAAKWNIFRIENEAEIPELFWTYGIHPEFCDNEITLPTFDKDKPIAIGEIGLDYHYNQDLICGIDDKSKQFEAIIRNHNAQKKLLISMLDLAVDNNLPVSFHVRDAFDDFFEIVDKYNAEYLNKKNYQLNEDETENGRSRIRAVIHSFSDSKKNLQKCLARGFYIGVNGLATYSTLATPPLSRTLFETDAPFLIPAPFHEHHKPGDNSAIYGLHRNDSSYIKTIAEWKTNELKALGEKLTFEDVCEVTSENADKLFNL